MAQAPEEQGEAMSAVAPGIDWGEATRRRDEALAAVETKHRTWVQRARDWARVVARNEGVVVADDVRAIMYAIPDKPKHPNAWGAVFRSDDFEFTGEYRRSGVPDGHGNMQRVWRLREAAK